MKQKCDRAVADRRSFLKLAGASAVAGTAALVTGKKTAEADTTADKVDGSYKQTDHIKTYYELARF
ncbi:MAG: twin-arginine translocation signal domain-containing protein [Pseudomonadota bacterium]|nr:twin-arginine translocation signal domain-containing protein [Pseudomonadota bacterium]